MKNRYRTLGIGFLISAIIVAAFAILVQGHSPKGVKISSLSAGTANTKEIASYQEEISVLTDELESEKNSRNQLNDTIASLKEEKAKYEKEVSSLKRSSNKPEDESGETASSQADVQGSFSISEGQASSEIAQSLADQGFISSADELLQLIDEWGLHSAIQAGSYDLNSDMSIHDIASIITQGAYYYN